MQLINRSSIDPEAPLSYLWSLENGSWTSTEEAPAVTLFNQTGQVLFPQFSLQVASAQCTASLSRSDLVAVLPQPVAAFRATPDSVSVFDGRVEFINQSSADAISFYWELDHDEATATGRQVFYQYPDAGRYEVMLEATNQWGCLDTALQRVVVWGESTLYLPNAFTPDGDGLNDVFRVEGEELESGSFSLTVFNRWGELIFSTTNPAEGWNGYYQGQLSPVGVYPFRLTYLDVNSGLEKTLTGAVTLVR